ncbi:MAG: hypothetical protein NVSMB31_15870 [Vulcanimicrobiaceae bacterium]
MKPHLKRTVALILAAGLCRSPYAQASSLWLTIVSEVALPGHATRLDYQSLDTSRHLLFIAHLADSEVIVFDTKARRTIATVAGVALVHGVLAVPQLNIVYASATGTNELVAIDENTFKIVARSPAGNYPDGIAFDPRTKHVFVSDEHGKTETVVDANTNARVATIVLGAEAGNTQYDPRSHHIFVTIHSGFVIEIDPLSNRIVRRISLSGCKGSHGLLIDPKTARAYIACADDAKLVVLNMNTGGIASLAQVGDDPDVLTLDTKNRRVYIAAESGVLTIVNDRKAVNVVARGFFAESAHSVVYDPEFNVLYFPLENRGRKPALRIEAPR